MGGYGTLHVKREVHNRLIAKKARLEEVYKIEITWSDFMCLLMKNGTCEKVSAQDINEIKEKGKFTVVPIVKDEEKKSKISKKSKEFKGDWWERYYWFKGRLLERY